MPELRNWVGEPVRLHPTLAVHDAESSTLFLEPNRSRSTWKYLQNSSVCTLVQPLLWLDKKQGAVREKSRNPLRAFQGRLIRTSSNARPSLERLRQLEIGWDGYDALPPNDSAIENMLKVLDFLANYQIRIPELVPSAEGGVGLCLGMDPYFDIECLNSGEILVTEIGPGEPEVWEIDADRLREVTVGHAFRVGPSR